MQRKWETQAKAGLLLLAMATLEVRAADSVGKGSEPGTRMTLDQVILAALDNNPGLYASRLRAVAAGYGSLREGALPNPTLTVSAEDRASDFRVAGSDTVKVGLEQVFPWYGKRALRRQMAQADANSARLDVDAQRLDLKVRITEAAYGLHAALSTHSLLQNEMDLLKQLETVTRTKYATGTADQQDVAKAQAEITILKQRLTDVQSRETSLRARINTLMGRHADADLAEVIVPPLAAWPQPELSNWLARAEAANPELGKAGVAAARSQLEERLARREYFPDLKLMAEVTRMRDEDETLVMLGVGVDLPIQIAATRAGVREANRMARAAAAEREAMRQETEYMIQDLASCCASAWQNLELLKTQLTPQAEVRYKASEAAYTTGKAGFIDLLESQRFRLSVKMMVIAMETEVATQLARLARLLGGPLSDGVAERPGLRPAPAVGRNP